MENELLTLLGKDIRKLALEPFVKSFDGVFKIKHKRFDTDYHLTLWGHGIELAAREEAVVGTIFLYNVDGGKEGICQRPLPYGLQFSDSRNQVAKKLGRPLRTGGGDYDEVLKCRSPVCDTFEMEEGRLIVEYSEDETNICLICIMSHEFVRKYWS